MTRDANKWQSLVLHSSRDNQCQSAGPVFLCDLIYPSYLHEIRIYKGELGGQVFGNLQKHFRVYKKRAKKECWGRNPRNLHL